MRGKEHFEEKRRHFEKKGEHLEEEREHFEEEGEMKSWFEVEVPASYPRKAP